MPSNAGFTWPLRWAFTHAASMTVDPGVCQYVDLLDVDSAKPDEAWLTTVQAPREGHRLPARREPYSITVAVAGKNHPARIFELRVRHTGGWEGTPQGLPGVLCAEVVAR